ncbi:uncharacterized protein LOC110925532 [Helianthus annuus]|uniref:uncharacterized protein LOC110925532 n=1 Tax=Helianthus annuus TaxID=4232 RepID=UPI000B8FCD31|nr:uncharacterized protein LOC110925532 [Helianthus annuus]
MMMITDDDGAFDGGGDWGCRVEEMGERGGGGGGGDVFKSREKLMEWVRNTGRSLSYAIVTKRSKTKNGYVSKVVLMCDRGGVYKSVKESSKATGSRKINCPFEMVGKYSKENGYWTLKVKHGEHNHPPGEYMEGHPIFKRLKPNEHQLVAELTGKHVLPKDILGMIKECDENNVSTIKNIYNARDKIRAKEHKGKSLMEMLMSHLQDKGWHISQSIFRNCKESFTTERDWNSFNVMWNVLVESQTWTSFLQYYKQLQSMLIHHQDVLDYLNSTWLNKYKEMFVFVWTNECLHFGNQTTNRVESQHAKLKRFLNLANCTLDKFIGHVDEVVNSQYTIVKDSFEKSRTVVMHKHNLPMLKLLRGFISHEALDIIIAERRLNRSHCRCQVRKCYALPCACEISKYKKAGQSIPLDSVDEFWRKLELPVHCEDITCDVELESFKKAFDNRSKPGKKSLLPKLKEITNPSIRFVEEPDVKENTRGRPATKSKQKNRTL